MMVLVKHEHSGLTGLILPNCQYNTMQIASPGFLGDILIYFIDIYQHLHMIYAKLTN